MRVLSGLAATVVLILALPAGAGAQAFATQDLIDLQGKLKVGDFLRVTGPGGVVHKGTLVEITDSSIRLSLGDGSVSLHGADRIQVVEHRVTKKGPIIGGAIGLGFGLVMIERLRDCGGCGANGAGLFALMMTAAGVGIGALVQYTPSHSRDVYSAKRPDLAVAPVVTRSRLGVAVQIRF